MATAPPWSFGLDDDVRGVLVHGLPSATTSWREPLDTARWNHLVAEAARHRLGGLLVDAVATGALPTTADQAAEAAQIEVGLTLARLTYEVHAASILDGLDRAGVEVRVLKGPALAALDYPDPQWRPSGDLDLLVHGAQLDQAVAALVARGGVRSDPDPTPGYGAIAGKGATIEIPDELEVDLHRLLVWGAFGVRTLVDDLWGPDARSFLLGGVERRALSIEASLLHACYHLVVRGWRRALTLRDVGQLLAGATLDEDRTLWLARRWGSEAVLASALLLAQRELRLAVDGSILLDWAHGYPPTVADRLWLRVERPGTRFGPIEAIGAYASLATADERAVLRRATLHPDPGTWSSPADRLRHAARRALGPIRDRDRFASPPPR